MKFESFKAHAIQLNHFQMGRNAQVHTNTRTHTCTHTHTRRAQSQRNPLLTDEYMCQRDTTHTESANGERAKFVEKS